LTPRTAVNLWTAGFASAAVVQGHAPKPPSEPLEGALSALGVPLLFAKHEGCLLHTTEGYEDAVAAFPDARTTAVPEKPSTSPAFAEALHTFCAELEAGRS
jgi:hypothetical protein